MPSPTVCVSRSGMGFLSVASPRRRARAPSRPVDPQRRLVDEVVLDQRAGETGAADDDFPVELVLELCDLGHHVALRSRGDRQSARGRAGHEQRQRRAGQRVAAWDLERRQCAGGGRRGAEPAEDLGTDEYAQRAALRPHAGYATARSMSTPAPARVTRASMSRCPSARATDTRWRPSTTYPKRWGGAAGAGMTSAATTVGSQARCGAGVDRTSGVGMSAVAARAQLSMPSAR
jgi:hypothetical protein